VSAPTFRAPARGGQHRRRHTARYQPGQSGGGGRGPRRAHPAAGADPATLDEIPFAELACRLVFSRSKGADAPLWARLLEADLVVRTETALQRAQERNAAAIERRREEWILYAEARVGSKVDATEWQLAQNEFRAWCARAESFAGVVAKALVEVERARRKHVRHGGETGDSAHYRYLLQTLAGAIRTHRVALDDAEVIAEGHDIALWSVLDTVAVPHGRSGEQKTLATMFDEQIWELN
jgi:hypothetical protein